MKTISQFVFVSVLSVIAIAADGPNPLPALDEARVEISGIGVSFRPVANWHTAGRQALIKNLDRYDFSESELQRILSSSSGSRTIASFMRDDPKITGGVIPTLNIIAVPTNDTSDQGVAVATNTTLAAMRRVLKNLNVSKPLNEVTLNGAKVFHFKLEYDLTSGGGETFRIESETYVIPRKRMLLQVSMSEKIPAEERQTFETFMRAIEIDAQ